MAKFELKNMLFVSSKVIGTGYKLFILADEDINKITVLGPADIPDFDKMARVDATLSLTQDLETRETVIDGKSRRIRNEVNKLFLQNLRKSN